MISQVAVFGFVFTVAQYGVVSADTQLHTSQILASQAVASHSLTKQMLASKDQMSGQSGSAVSASETKVQSEQSEERAVALLNRMVKSSRTLNYQGSVVYSHDGVVESMQVIHKNGPDGELERLVQLNGVPREVIRKNDVVTCYMSGSRSVLVGRRNLSGNLLAKLNTKLTDFANTYSFQVKGLGRVAGKVTRVIDIQPRDKYRYGYKLWLNEDNALLLKSELVDGEGKVLERVMFVQIDVVDSIPDSMFNPSISGESYTWHKGKLNSDSSVVQLDDWLFSTLPTGFKITTATKQQMPNSESLADHVVITDGLASISVYIESFGVQSQPFVGLSHMGAVNIYGAVIGDHQVTVVGEVPHVTVKMIAESVRPASPTVGSLEKSFN